MTLTLGTDTDTACTPHIGEACTDTGDTLGTDATAGIHQDGTGDGTGTTTGDGTLGMQIHIGDGMIRSTILGGVRHTGPAIGLYTDLQYALAIIRDIIRLQAPAQNLAMAKKFIMEKETVPLLTTITRAIHQTAV